MESIGFITFDHRILAGMCGNVTEATQAILHTYILLPACSCTNLNVKFVSLHQEQYMEVSMVSVTVREKFATVSGIMIH